MRIGQACLWPDTDIILRIQSFIILVIGRLDPLPCRKIAGDSILFI